MRIYPLCLAITLISIGTLSTACGNDTLRAQTPTTTTGPYNTGTTATPGLSASKAQHALGEDSRQPVGPIAPSSSAEATTTSAPVAVPTRGN